MASTAQTSDAALQYVDTHQDEFLEGLKDLLRIPSISTLPKHRKDIQRAAKFVADAMEEAGLKKVKIIKTDVHPLVYGEWLEAKGKPTVLLYGHYDVQPVDPIDLWDSPPFEPTVRNDNIYARGAVDDKGQMYALILALKSLMTTTGGLPVNVRVLIEGEEEYGGESIEKYVKEHPKKLACDVALVADTGMPAPGVPALVYALRGILYTEIHAQGAKHDLHSGEYGGVAPNPIHALAEVLLGLKGPDGHITLPEIYKRIIPMTDEERDLWDRNPVDVIASMKHEMGVDMLPGEQEYDPRERQTARPTLEVHGIKGGFVDEGAKTVIPAEATAKVSLRLPPGLRPMDVLPMLRKRVAELCPPGVKMEVRLIHGGDAVLVPLENVYLRAAERALEQEWGRPPVFERSGGSIPVGALFDSELHAPIVFMGTGLPDDNIHAPNEKYHIPNFYHLIRQAIRFLDIIGSDPAIVSRPGSAGASAKANGKAAAPKAGAASKPRTATKASAKSK
ncbi:MAG: dipeptidase [Ktedonobacterales bacterium]|jgi:acetylornithine deacetylase/succinyl-diaminopimelate desuccinylase-like protein|nr:MAG: dipeptidase [Ktedonobacterales bacterium]